MEYPTFTESHPNYGAYTSEVRAVNALPLGFASAFESFLIARCKNDARSLKTIINAIAAKTLTSPTTNWGFDFLAGELGYYVRELCKKPLPVVMDLLFEIAVDEGLRVSTKETNIFLDAIGLGYRIEGDLPMLREWVLVDGVETKIASIETAASAVSNICDQTLEHLDQAKRQLSSNHGDRARKDAVRDCLSAMETMLKRLSGQSSINNAVKALIESGEWGNEHTIKHGHKLWTILHQYHQDLRHGNLAVSQMTENEALYWVDCITNFVTYLARVQSESSNKEF